MKSQSFKTSVALALVGVLAGCVPSLWSKPTGGDQLPTLSRQGGVQVTQDGDTTTLQRLDTILVGQVSLGDGDRQVQASLGDVVNNASVALIDPASNVTVATSVTDGSGNFSIPLPTSWNPAQGSNFVLEAFKGLGSNAAGQNVVRLRTMVQKLAGQGNFTSITGTDSIGVNPMTTAVYLKSLAGFGTVPIANTFYGDNKGTVNNLGNLRQANQFTTWSVTDAQLTNLRTLITDTVTGNYDPVAAANSALQPVVDNFSTYTAPVGSLVSINGSGFNPVPSGNTVTFNPGVTASILYGSKSQLVVAVPAGATSGNVTVQTSTGTSAPTNFTVSAPVGSATGAPVVANIDNATPAPGNTLQIGGVNFVNGVNTVTFSAGGGTTVNGSGTYVNANQLTVTVPASAKSGPLTVTNSNGTSNGYWVEIIHGSGTLVETFADSSRNDTTATNLGQWVGGISPVGAGTTLGSTIADFDAMTGVNVQRVYDNGNPNYPASVQLAITETYPHTNGQVLPTDLYQTVSTGYLVATNGRQIYFGNTTPTMMLMSTGFDGMSFGFRNPAPTITGFGATANYKMVGLVGANNYFYLDETTPSFFGLSYQNLSNPFAPTGGSTAFYAQDGTSALGLYKNASATNGSKIGSDGTYIYVLSGQGYVAGVPTYTQAWNLYKFRPDSYLNPTKLILAEPPFQNITLPGTNYVNTQYTGLMVDRRAFYLSGYASGGSVDSMTPYSLRTGASKNLTVRFRNGDGNYANVTWDPLNDVYYAVNHSNTNWYRNYIASKAYETTGTITTGVQTLPAGQAWSQVGMVVDSLPAGANVTFDVLDAAGTPLGAYRNLTPGASLRNLATTNIRIRVNLSGNGSVTPVVRAINLLTIPTSPIARSTAIQIPGADANDRIIIDSVQYTHTLNGGTITYQYADSADNTAYSSFQNSFTSVSRRYLKWQVVPTVATATESAMVPPIVRRVQINYHY